jgi:hypothetical protein
MIERKYIVELTETALLVFSEIIIYQVEKMGVTT